jgi:endonuclease YncB( thermonuclease family)
MLLRRSLLYVKIFTLMSALHAILSILVLRKWLILADVLTSLRSALVLLVVLSSSQMTISVSKKGSFRSLFLCLCCVLSTGVQAAASCDLSVEGLKAGAIESLGVERVEVAQVFDGDTVLLADGRKIRVIGVNTPELGHHNRPIEPLAMLAQQTLTQLLLEASAKRQQKLPVSALLRVGGDLQDHYGRTLGHLFSSAGINVTSRLLIGGLGFHVAIPPNLWSTDCYFAAQQKARSAKVGVWSLPYYSAKLASAKKMNGGYQRINGKIEKIFISRKSIWVDLLGDVTIKLNRQNSKSQQGEVLKRIMDAYENKGLELLPAIEIQGWMIDRKRWGDKMAAKIQKGERNRWQFSLSHRYQWHFISAN